MKVKSGRKVRKKGKGIEKWGVKMGERREKRNVGGNEGKNGRMEERGEENEEKWREMRGNEEKRSKNEGKME